MNKNLNKKQQKEFNNNRRNLWTISPITKIVKSKKQYNRKNKSWKKEIGL